MRLAVALAVVVVTMLASPSTEASEGSAGRWPGWGEAATKTDADHIHLHFGMHMAKEAKRLPVFRVLLASTPDANGAMHWKMSCGRRTDPSLTRSGSVSGPTTLRERIGRGSQGMCWFRLQGSTDIEVARIMIAAFQIGWVPHR